MSEEEKQMASGEVRSSGAEIDAGALAALVETIGAGTDLEDVARSAADDVRALGAERVALLRRLAVKVGELGRRAGGPTVALLGAAGLALGWGALVGALDLRRHRYRREGAERERELLAGDARWFSEDPETEWLLRAFARGRVDQVRDEWRRRRSEREASLREARVGP